MDSIRFYPCLTEELLDKCGCDVEKYHFSYDATGGEAGLVQKGTSVLKLSDPLDLWKLKEDGVKIRKKLSIAYPDFLKGPTGVACKGANLGFCIIWTNNKLTQTGHILPLSDVTSVEGKVCWFEHTFNPGEIDGDLRLTLCAYIKEPAAEVLEGEEILMNNQGVSVGEIEDVVVDFDSIYMDFPIEEYSSADEPLWWIEFSQWEDPKTIEEFSKENLCLYLNPHYSSCPMTDGAIKNIDLLIEILAMAYFLMFDRLKQSGDLEATRNNIGLKPNSICSILHQFIEECNEGTGLRFETNEMLLKSLQVNLRAKLQEEEPQ